MEENTTNCEHHFCQHLSIHVLLLAKMHPCTSSIFLDHEVVSYFNRATAIRFLGPEIVTLLHQAILLYPSFQNQINRLTQIVTLFHQASNLTSRSTPNQLHL